MSATYTAWNGEERAWPPPENWYRAVDGRWWHPAFGPGDEPDVAHQPEPEPQPDPEPQHPDPATTADAQPPGRARRLLSPVVLIAVTVLAIVTVTAVVAGSSTDDVATVPGQDPASPLTAAESGPTRFRRVLADHDLSTVDLTDEEITDFASSYCAHAVEAEDQTAFDNLRRVAITAADTNLTPAQLDLTITAAIMAFCPAESDRLGLSEAQAGS